MTIISKQLAEAVGKGHGSRIKGKNAPDLFRGPEFTGSEECLKLLLKLKSPVKKRIWS